MYVDGWWEGVLARCEAVPSLVWLNISDKEVFKVWHFGLTESNSYTFFFNLKVEPAHFVKLHFRIIQQKWNIGNFYFLAANSSSGFPTWQKKRNYVTFWYLRPLWLQAVQENVRNVIRELGNLNHTVEVQLPKSQMLSHLVYWGLHKR